MLDHLYVRLRGDALIELEPSGGGGAAGCMLDHVRGGALEGT